jgi:hypothetical protein
MLPCSSVYPFFLTVIDAGVGVDVGMAVSVGRLVSGTTVGEGISINGAGASCGAQLPITKTIASAAIKKFLMPGFHLAP